MNYGLIAKYLGSLPLGYIPNVMTSPTTEDETKTSSTSHVKTESKRKLLSLYLHNPKQCGYMGNGNSVFAR